MNSHFGIRRHCEIHTTILVAPMRYQIIHKFLVRNDQGTRNMNHEESEVRCYGLYSTTEGSYNTETRLAQLVRTALVQAVKISKQVSMEVTEIWIFPTLWEPQQQQILRPTLQHLEIQALVAQEFINKQIDEETEWGHEISALQARIFITRQICCQEQTLRNITVIIFQ